ncbi:hypothetical protein C2845_PM09G05290 [Panicum miliaceum]|uniref:Ionotropic glutamate receptor C-terminal domain-containing protein n=1 Tax=Panicum miliaceum TaxID=4540 RepID=A0A3L6RYZ5_PANMI|nr:hypothetical protein C2845_PM09G05290 [Panicum miliaceum]
MFWSVGGSAAAAVAPTLPVGVVLLDLASGGGRRSLGSISSMAALDDLYVKHPSKATRVGRHVRDVPAAHAVPDTRRIDDRGLVRRSPSARPRGHEKLVIAVPQKHGFHSFLDFAIDIFRTAMANLQHPPQYELHAFNGTYDELVGNVSIGVFRGAAGDVTITADRARDADFTMPYTQSGVSLLVLADNDSDPPIQWIFLDPLTTELWFTTVVFFFLTAFVVWMIERPSNPVYQGSTVTQFSTASYFAFSTLTFSHGQIIRSPLSKVVVVIWCFAVLVLVQSYTANLSSILTAKRLRPLVTGLDQMVFPKGSSLVHDLSIAILDLTGGNESSQIERKWFPSAAPFSGDNSRSADYKPLTLRSFSGLFVITAGVSASMLFISIIWSVYARHSKVTSSESQSADGNDGSVCPGESSAVQNDAGNGSVPAPSIGPVQESTQQDGRSSGSVPEVSVQVEISSISQDSHGCAA